MKTAFLFDNPEYQPTKPEPWPRKETVGILRLKTHSDHTVPCCGVCKAKQDLPMLDGTNCILSSYEIAGKGTILLCQRCLAFAKDKK